MLSGAAPMAKNETTEISQITKYYKISAQKSGTPFIEAAIGMPLGLLKYYPNVVSPRPGHACARVWGARPQSCPRSCTPRPRGSPGGAGAGLLPGGGVWRSRRAPPTIRSVRVDQIDVLGPIRCVFVVCLGLFQQS